MSYVIQDLQLWSLIIPYISSLITVCFSVFFQTLEITFYGRKIGNTEAITQFSAVYRIRLK